MVGGVAVGAGTGEIVIKTTTGAAEEADLVTGMTGEGAVMIGLIGTEGEEAGRESAISAEKTVKGETGEGKVLQWNTRRE